MFYKTSNTSRYCYTCAVEIKPQERYVEAYNHHFNHAFLALMWFCEDCGTKISKVNNKSIKEKQ